MGLGEGGVGLGGGRGLGLGGGVGFGLGGGGGLGLGGGGEGEGGGDGGVGGLGLGGSGGGGVPVGSATPAMFSFDEALVQGEVTKQEVPAASVVLVWMVYTPSIAEVFFTRAQEPATSTMAM